MFASLEPPHKAPFWGSVFNASLTKVKAHHLIGPAVPPMVSHTPLPLPLINIVNIKNTTNVIFSYLFISVIFPISTVEILKFSECLDFAKWFSVYGCPLK